MWREELAGPRRVFTVGVAGAAVAVLFGSIALLLLAATIAVLLARLFDSPLAGVAVAFLLYAVIAAVGGGLAARSLSRVRPFDFPVTAGEVKRDLASLREAAAPPPREPLQDMPPERDVERRFREGSE